MEYVNILTLRPLPAQVKVCPTCRQPFLSRLKMNAEFYKTCDGLEQVASSRGRGHRVVEEYFIALQPPGPASVHSRCVPRGTSPRRRGDRPQGQARSYAGAAQCPCAGRIGGSPRAET